MKNIIALGAENKTCFSAISKGGLYVSEAIANISEAENFYKFEDVVKRYMVDNNLAPDYIVCDFHPDYHSTSLAEKIQRENKNSKLVRVQHHFAHIAACMLDNDIDEKILGVSFDGTGLGTDGKSWGGEFLLSTRKNFNRLYHLKYIPQPGGDIAAKEGWRMAIAYLIDAFGKDFENIDHPLFEKIGKAKINIIKQMIDKDINCPLTSSMGRLFDAVSCLLSIRDVSNFEAEAAILLEKEAKADISAYYNYEIIGSEIVVSKMIRGIMDDLNKGIDKPIISSMFHNTIAEIIFDASVQVSESHNINKVLLSGGCFQNKYLMSKIEKKFKHSKLKLFKHNRYSTTDLGVSIGQAVVAANM